MTIKTGDPIPGFCLRDQHNEEICIKKFLGSWVVLFAYVKDLTPG